MLDLRWFLSPVLPLVHSVITVFSFSICKLRTKRSLRFVLILSVNSPKTPSRGQADHAVPDARMWKLRLGEGRGSAWLQGELRLSDPTWSTKLSPPGLMLLYDERPVTSQGNGSLSSVWLLSACRRVVETSGGDLANPQPLGL